MTNSLTPPPPQAGHPLPFKPLVAGTTDSAGTAWLLHSQRSAAALIALLALQPDLRERLVAEGALTGLGTVLRNAGRIAVKGSSNGLLVQLRVTAAAALVPLLGM